MIFAGISQARKSLCDLRKCLDFLVHSEYQDAAEIACWHGALYDVCVSFRMVVKNNWCSNEKQLWR